MKWIGMENSDELCLFLMDGKHLNLTTRYSDLSNLRMSKSGKKNKDESSYC